MLGVTVFGIFFTPVFYAVLERLRDRGQTVPVPPTGEPALAATDDRSTAANS
jgi:hypothetical protein